MLADLSVLCLGLPIRESYISCELNINLSLLNGHFKTQQRYRANIKVKINEQKVTMNIFCGLIVRVF
jgi:hypothetical protein